MARYSKNKDKVSDQTKSEAMAIAKGTQKPGQTKEQTKLVAQGIQKGIELYKKQQKAKARELDKQLKKAKQTSVDMNSGKDSESAEQNQAEVATKSWTWVPWVLLFASWAGFGVYLTQQ